MAKEAKETGRIDKNAFQEIGDLFRLPGEVKKVVLIKDGSVATTYRVDYSTKKNYLFQKVKVTLEDFAKTMENVEKISNYLKKFDRSLIHFHHTNDKTNYINYKDECWRVGRYFDSFNHTDSSSLDILRDLGVSIGSFQYFTRKFDHTVLHDVCPDIHNLNKLIDGSDEEYVLRHKEQALKIQNTHEKGLIPVRVVHNDTKIRTIYIKDKPQFYLNLDLVKSGVGLYDFASVALLFCSTTQFGKESETKLDIEKFEAYVAGYISVTNPILTKTEKELLVSSLFSMAIENIIVNKKREQQKQWCLSMARDIESNWNNLEAIIKKTIVSTKKIKPFMHESSIDRDLPSSGGKQYRAGDYMDIHIPHFIKPKKGKFYLFLKRFFDIVCSFLGLIVLFPFLFIVGLLVICTSKGPMLYVSKRVGKNGRIFNFYKFRSMYKDAEQRLSELLDKNEIEGGVTFKMKNDPRITPFGKFIRKTSIDELPQLINVLKGDMSLIGPRAALPREVEIYPEEALDRLTVPQGLSGEWQANGRSDTSFDNMIKMDLDYVQNKRGFWHDAGLVFKTLWVVLRGKGAE